MTFVQIEPAPRREIAQGGLDRGERRVGQGGLGLEFG